MSLIAREQVVYKDDEESIPLPVKKEEKQEQWPADRGEDIRLPPPERPKGQEDNSIDW